MIILYEDPRLDCWVMRNTESGQKLHGRNLQFHGGPMGVLDIWKREWSLPDGTDTRLMDTTGAAMRLGLRSAAMRPSGAGQ